MGKALWGSKTAGGVLLIGPLPPPETGQSVSFEMLVREAERREIIQEAVDISRQGCAGTPGVSIRRLREMVGILALYTRAISRRPQRLYLTIAQSRSGFFRDAYMIWLASLLRVPTVVHLKGGNYDGFYRAQWRILRCFIRRTLLRVERILVLGENLRAMYSFEPKLSRRVRVVANGLPIELEAMKKSLPSHGGAVELLFLSNLIQTKGYIDVIKAVAKLVAEHGMRVRCVFAGRFLTSSDDEVALSATQAEVRFGRIVGELGVEDVVEYVGPVSGAAKWALLQQAHIFVLPTRYVNEGQPVSIIEAMACGCVTISTSFRAIPDLVVDGQNGVMVDYGAPAQIADAVASLAAEPDRFAAMSAAAAERYQRFFTMRAHLDRIVPHLVGANEGAASVNA